MGLTRTVQESSIKKEKKVHFFPEPAYRGKTNDQEQSNLTKKWKKMCSKKEYKTTLNSSNSRYEIHLGFTTTTNLKFPATWNPVELTT